MANVVSNGKRSGLLDGYNACPFLNMMVEQFQHLPEKIVGNAEYGSEPNYEMIMDDYDRMALIPYHTY